MHTNGSLSWGSDGRCITAVLFVFIMQRNNLRGHAARSPGATSKHLGRFGCGDDGKGGT